MLRAAVSDPVLWGPCLLNVFFNLLFTLLEAGDDLTYNIYLERNQISGWFCLFMVLCKCLSISADLL